MSTYIVKRLLLMIPTLLMVLLINFVVIQLAPGGPVEQAIYQSQHANNLAIGGLQYQGQQGLTLKCWNRSRFSMDLINRFIYGSGKC